MRVHMTSRRLLALRDRPDQQASRKPDGLWWAEGGDWRDCVRNGRAEGRRADAPCLCYAVETERAGILRLSEWGGVLAFTARHGTGNFGQALPVLERLARPISVAGRDRIMVPAIAWPEVQALHDGIEVSPEVMDDPSRPWLQWLDTDWAVASGCAWRTSGIRVAGPFSWDEVAPTGARPSPGGP